MEVLRVFLDYIHCQRLFNEDDRLLLAVSGGKDSVFMAQLFAQSNYNFGIAHCNFQLREEESNEDANFVEELAKKLKVPFFKTSFDTREFANREKISIQMAARDLRYDWLERIRITEGYSFIAVAHHQTDSVETVLLNLVRGTGIAGLHGILAKRGYIVRPLLAFTSDQVAQYIYGHHLDYREDQSNKEVKYARNKIRLEVLPALRAINPGLERTFSLASKRFLSLEKFLDQQIKDVRKRLFVEKEVGVFSISIVSMDAFVENYFVLYEIFKPFGFSEAVLRDLVESLSNPQSGSMFYSETHQVLVNRDELIVREIQDEIEKSIFIHQLPMNFNWDRKSYSVFHKDISASKESLSKPEAVVLDANKVAFPIEVRSWEEGDFFRPLGLGGKKKISDFLINQKISLDQKRRIPLFVNTNQDILSVAVIRIDDRYKVTAETKKVIIFEQL